MGRIIQIGDAPLPTPDPWAGDGSPRRCPACALPDPGDARCRRCKAALITRVDRRRPLTANLLNLCVVLFGKGPMLLAVGFLYRPEGAPLLSPWTLWLAGQIPLLLLAAAGLALRWRWAWYLAMALALVDLLAAVGFQLRLGGSPVLPIAALLTDLMIMGLLLTVFDSVRVDYAPLGLPPDEALPRTALDAYNAGAAYSKAGHWYLAARLWQRAAALEHHEGRYRRALGLAYLRLRELPAAEAELAAARTLLPDDPQTAQLIAALGQLRDRAATK